MSDGFDVEVLVFLNSQKPMCNTPNVVVIVSVATIDQPQNSFVECSIFSVTDGTESSSCVFICDMQAISANELQSVNFYLLDQRSFVADTIDVCDINIVYLL